MGAMVVQNENIHADSKHPHRESEARFPDPLASVCAARMMICMIRARRVISVYPLKLAVNIAYQRHKAIESTKRV